MRMLFVCLAAVVLVGCGPPPPGQSQGEQQSGAQDVIETMAQKNAMDAGRKAAEKVRAIGAQEKKDYEEAAGQ